MDRLSAVSRRNFDARTSDKSDTLYNIGLYNVPSLFQGDSGGPLQLRAHSPMCDFEVVGIVSFGLGCAKRDTPAIYTRVSKYVPWIESVVCSYKDGS
jgi:secreted trypsin-like serine protease